MLGEQLVSFIIRAFVSLNYNLVFERATQKFISANKNSYAYGTAQIKVWWTLDEKSILKWLHQWCLYSGKFWGSCCLNAEVKPEKLKGVGSFCSSSVKKMIDVLLYGSKIYAGITLSPLLKRLS